MTTSWIAADLDGTLAMYDGWRGAGHIGPPVPAMVARVQAWLAAGQQVRIFTARVSGAADIIEVERAAIEAWCAEHNIGQILPITSETDYLCRALYDDRAVAVEANTGRLLSPEIPTPSAACAMCGEPEVRTRTPTADGRSHVVATRCGCGVFTYREDLAAKVCAP